MTSEFQLLLFGDETGDFRGPLQELCENRHGILFSRFIDDLNILLHDEIYRQRRHVKEQIPHFRDVRDLVRNYQDSDCQIQVLKTPLLCIFQLGNVISFFDDHPTHSFTGADSVPVGLCTGLLAAAAVSASQSSITLVENALSAVRVAFRIGAMVNNVAQRLSTGSNQSWSRLVVGAQREACNAEIMQFNDRKTLPHASQAYISSSSADTVTISGPPATTTALFSESGYLRQRRSIALDIFGPFHAPHLYSDADIEEILGAIVKTNALGQSLRQVVDDILIRPLEFDNIIARVVSKSKASGRERCNISSIGPSSALSSIVSSLRAGTKLEVSIGEQFKSTKSTRDRKSSSQKIAIVGMSGRFPNADSIEKLWDLLEQGLDVHRRVPRDRFDIDAHYDPTGKKKNTSHTPYGCFIDEPGLFDARFFNMSPREAYQTDPMGRLALVTAYEALEMSGFIPNRTPSSMTDRVGTFYGQSSDDWRQVNAAENVDTYYIPGNIRAFGPGRINYHFKFKGPSYNVDTACSSSFSAIQLACTSLQAKECDTAIAGGLNIMSAPDLYCGLSRAQFLSKTGSCKTFDDGADGFCRGDGVATVVLKRLEDAEADNDLILGVILGVSTNHSSEAVSITQPHAPTQESLYRKVLRDSRVDARDVSYVEMHGTGTQAGDGAEMRSISNVFAPRKEGLQSQVRSSDQTVHVGALKANIGHGEASAGASSLIKVLLMLQRNVIPPHVGIKGVMNRGFPADLEERGVRIAFKSTPWIAPDGGKRRAYLNNFSAAGGNTGLLLEDAPLSTRVTDKDPRTAFVVSMTAKSAWSLKMNIQRLISYLKMNPDTSLPKLSYTTTARRAHHPYRVSFAVTNITEATEALRSAQAEAVQPSPMKSPPRVVFVFTGQGSHYPSLGKQLFENSRQFRSDILDFDRIGCSQGFPSFLPLVDGTIADTTQFSPIVLQLGQCCIQMALARLWISWGISPSAVMGHSLGEYAALFVARVLSLSDTIYLVGRRAQLLGEHCTAGTHSLLAVAGSVAATCEALGGDKPDIACVNGPRETVISGPTENLMTSSKILKATGIKSVVLPCAYAFHSAQVTSILEPLIKSARSVAFAKPTVPVISPLLQEVVSDGDVIGPEYLARHARETVNFLGGITAGKENGLTDETTIWLEVGPTPICSSFVKSSLGSEMVTIPSLHKKEDPWRTLSNGLSLLHRKGSKIDWDEVHSDYESSHMVLNLPSYTFENKTYWLDYHNNWCLTKGEALEPPAEKRKSGRLSTSSVHKVIKQEYGERITIVAESDLSEPDLNDAIFGHQVNGAALCPAGLYADIAMTLAGHLHRKVNKTEDFTPMDVAHLEITKPAIAKSRHAKAEQLLRITATAERSLSVVNFTYHSVSEDGSDGDFHASCEVRYGDSKSLLAEWSRFDYLFYSRIDHLARGVKAGKYQKISREQAYDDFSKFVQYGKKYQGMKEVIIDSKNFEASSLIEFQANDNDGEFDANPYWIDNIAHLSGFVLNGSDAVDSRKQVYISHGWESMQIVRPLTNSRSYRNHVRMHPGPGKTMVGDVHVFDGDEMVALVAGVKFQAIPRSLLDKLLPPLNVAAQHPALKVTGAMKGMVHQSVVRNIKLEKQPPSTPKTPTQKVSASASPPRNGNKTITAFMAIISEELGLEPSELHDGVAFADIGLDSLMSLTVSGRLREESDIDVPTTFFTDKATIGEAKFAILAQDGGNEADTQSESASIESASTGSAPTTDSMDGAQITRNTSVGTDLCSYPTEDIIEKLLGTVSEEIGIERDQILEMSDFADMGVDSLMSLSIIGRVREELDLDLPSNFFVDHPSVDKARIAIGALGGTALSGSTTPWKDSSDSIPDDMDTPPIMHGTDDQEPVGWTLEDHSHDSTLRPATSILLSGSPKTSSKSLFLLPDGSGSATSFSLLPNISPDVCVYALNCPFMKTPADFTNGIDGVAEQYLAEIKRRQPQGPYYLGGWSAGGVLAYQVAYKLLEMGERTERLFLIDSPCPIDLEPLPASLLQFIDSLGLLGTRGTSPDWLIPHFEATMKNLKHFVPRPMKAGDAPKTLLILARDGVLKDARDQSFSRSKGETRSVKWLLDSRSGLGSYGWEKLIGDENIIVMNVPGNHFSVIGQPDVEHVASLLRRGLSV